MNNPEVGETADLYTQQHAGESVAAAACNAVKIAGFVQRQTHKEEALGLPPMKVRRDGCKIGRNDPCSCGSKRKFKNCCYRFYNRRG